MTPQVYVILQGKTYTKLFKCFVICVVLVVIGYSNKFQVSNQHEVSGSSIVFFATPLKYGFPSVLCSNYFRKSDGLAKD